MMDVSRQVTTNYQPDSKQAGDGTDECVPPYAGFPWYRWVIDLGITGPDKDGGSKYLVLPPGYKGEFPTGYEVVRSSIKN